MKLYLIRYAETISNIQGISFDNILDAELTDTGKKQAEILAGRLSQINFHKVFVSESKRTSESIRPLQ